MKKIILKRTVGNNDIPLGTFDTKEDIQKFVEGYCGITFENYKNTKPESTFESWCDELQIKVK